MYQFQHFHYFLYNQHNAEIERKIIFAKCVYASVCVCVYTYVCVYVYIKLLKIKLKTCILFACYTYYILSDSKFLIRSSMVNIKSFIQVLQTRVHDYPKRILCKNVSDLLRCLILSLLSPS